MSVASDGGTAVTRWGFLGAGFVATRALAPAVHACPGARLVAAAAGDPDRAAALRPERVHRDYGDVLVDEGVDVVYVALSNEQHLTWTLAALAAGKDVLCEKPLGLSSAEVRLMTAAAADAGRLLVEATWYRWHPRTRRAEELLASGALGAVDRIDAAFTFGGVPPGNYRLDPSRGGGAWLDVGPYVANAVCWAAPESPVAGVAAHARLGPSGVDLAVEADVLLASGVEAHLHAGIDDVERQRLTVHGTSGSLTMVGPDAFTSWHGDSRLEWSAGTRHVEHFAPCDPYRLMVEAVGGRRAGDRASWLPPAGESLRTADLMDAVSEGWEVAAGRGTG